MKWKQDWKLARVSSTHLVFPAYLSGYSMLYFLTLGYVYSLLFCAFWFFFFVFFWSFPACMYPVSLHLLCSLLFTLPLPWCVAPVPRLPSSPLCALKSLCSPVSLSVCHFVVVSCGCCVFLDFVHCVDFFFSFLHYFLNFLDSCLSFSFKVLNFSFIKSYCAGWTRRWCLGAFPVFFL